MIKMKELMIPKNDLCKWLALNQLYDLSPVNVYRLARRLMTEEIDIFSVPPEKLVREGLSDKMINKIRNIDWLAIDSEIKWTEQTHHHIVTLQDSCYPALLREINTPPLVLYVWGDIEDLNQPQLAMVGSRNPSPIGEEIARQFAGYLAKGGLTITSGLAMGIDTSSHKGAISAGRSVAVLGSGLKHIYPARNQTLAEQISKGGAVISEFPLDTLPKRENFPRRNRIISGLSLGVLVVEAALQSGSLITARFAGEQGREVFTIPGSVHNPLAKGCHQLLRKGAKLVETAQDVIEELGSLFNFVELAGSSEEKTLAKEKIFTEKIDFFDLDDDYMKLLSCIEGETTAIDTIILRSGFSPKIVSSILLSLELRDYVKSVPGGYCRIYNVKEK